MKIADANIILRYLLNDHDELSNKSTNIIVNNIEVLEEAFYLFGQRRLDFVDTILYGYNRVKGYEIYTFDKKLNNVIKNNKTT